ncbi:hypothetical protein SH449x_003098 [Pirellulaceae bacterium SH449]
MAFLNINGSAASELNLSLCSVPPANGRKALYQCAMSLVRVGQLQQAERVGRDLLAQSVRYMDGKNYYAARRILCTIGSSNQENLGSMDGRPRFLLEAESRIQFDLFCANEELCSSRWENARTILQSVCSSLEQETDLDEYTSFAFGWLAKSIRQCRGLIRNVEENRAIVQELNSQWAQAIHNAEIAATQFPTELPAFCRESAWQQVWAQASIDSSFVATRLLEGAEVAQKAGMIREEHECLATWHEISQFRSESLPELPVEWQSRWNCLARQFSSIYEGEPNFDSTSYDGILNELEELQAAAKQVVLNNQATPQRNSHPQTATLVL